VGRENLGLLSRDSRGFALSLDLLLAIIPLTLVLGFVAADMDNIFYQMEDTIYRGSMDRTAFDTMNTLLQTSGDPTTWELNGTTNIAGLAVYDTKNGPQEGTISSGKLAVLDNNRTQNIIGSNYNFNLTVKRIDNNQVLKTLGSNYTNVKDVVRVEKVAIYTESVVVSSAKDLRRFTGTPITYTSPPYPFQTNTFYLQTYDYWVLIVNQGYNSADVNINGNNVVDQHDFNGQATRFANITKQIDPSALKNLTALTDNIVTVRGTSNPGDTLDIYIIQVPKGTPQQDITVDTITPKKVRVELFLWSTGT
jgi:hypothetical protein